MRQQFLRKIIVGYRSCSHVVGKCRQRASILQRNALDLLSKYSPLKRCLFFELFLKIQTPWQASVLSNVRLFTRSKVPVTRSRRNLQERDGKTLDPAGIRRKSSEHGSSIPVGKFLDFFRCIPITFLCFPATNWSEITGKNPEIFRPEYCFHVPVTSGVFLPEPSRIFWPRFESNFEKFLVSARSIHREKFSSRFHHSAFQKMHNIC